MSGRKLAQFTLFRKIFGAKGDEIIGEWRKLHNAELYVLLSSSNIIRNLNQDD